MRQTTKSRAHLKNTLYQEDKCEQKPFSACTQKPVRRATTWTLLPHPLSDTPVQASKIKYPQSLLELAAATHAAGGGDKLPGLDAK